MFDGISPLSLTLELTSRLEDFFFPFLFLMQIYRERRGKENRRLKVKVERPRP